MARAGLFAIIPAMKPVRNQRLKSVRMIASLSFSSTPDKAFYYALLQFEER